MLSNGQIHQDPLRRSSTKAHPFPRHPWWGAVRGEYNEKKAAISRPPPPNYPITRLPDYQIWRFYSPKSPVLGPRASSGSTKYSMSRSSSSSSSLGCGGAGGGGGSSGGIRTCL